MSKELLSIQYLRGLAAILVIYHHIFSTKGLEYLFLPSLGGFGVDIFFVISGFVMWYTTAEAKISTLEFWRRRVVRVVPLYWIFLAAVVVGALSFPNLWNSTVITPENTIKSFLFIPHYHVVQKIIAPILIPGWSLNYEMFFYFLFGITLLVPSRTLRGFVLTFFLSGLVLLGVVFHPTGALAATYTSAELLKFLDGMIVAMICRLEFIKGATFGLSLICAGVLQFTVYDAGVLNFIGLSPTLIVAGSLALEHKMRRAPSSIFRSIGNASYSIYLSHLFFLKLGELGLRHFGLFGLSTAIDVTYMIAVLLFAIGGGILVCHFIERPILLLFQKRHALVSTKSDASSRLGKADRWKNEADDLRNG